MINLLKKGVTEVYTQLLRNLMKGLVDEISDHQKKLPNRCLKIGYPKLFWAIPPFHDNFPEDWNALRQHFSKCLLAEIGEFPDMSPLRLLKVWNADGPENFADMRYTAKGFLAYWASVDSAFRHWDTFVYKKKNQTKKLVSPARPDLIPKVISLPENSRITRI